MSDALRIVRARNPGEMTLDGTRSFVVGRARPVVIDPGPALASHFQALDRALDGHRPAAILLTHAHGDHSEAAGPVARRYGVPVRIRPGALTDVGMATELLADGEVLETDAGPIRTIATPGHVPEHACFHWTGPEAPAGGVLFVGDLFMGQGDTTLVAFPEGDVAAYLGSLDRVEAVAPGILYPAHGEPLLEPAEVVGRYRRHRMARLEQVRKALADHPDADPGRLVELIYGPELHPALRGPASGSIGAMAEYLRRAGD